MCPQTLFPFDFVLLLLLQSPAEVAAVHRIEALIGKRLEELSLCPKGLAQRVPEMMKAEARALDKLRTSGFDAKASVYETAQRAYREMRKQREVSGMVM